MANNNAKMIDVGLYASAGINPAKIHANSMPKGTQNMPIGTPLKDNMFGNFNRVDRQVACNRYRWYNLPVGMSSQDLERLLYLKGQLAFFYFEELNQYFILPYALNGGIDVYGRFISISPIPLATTGDSDSADIKSSVEAMSRLFSGMKFECQYDVILPEELLEDPARYLTKSCVLLKDYTNDIGQNIIPRAQTQKPLMEIMSNIIPYLNTALMNSTGVSGVRVNNQDEAEQVKLASSAIQNASLNGNKWVPMKGQLDFQDFARSPIGASQDFLLALQSLQNIEASLYGLDNGGVYQKKTHMLQDEYEANTGSPMTALVYKDGLDIRQRFCNIVNSIWGIGIWCEPYTIEEMMDATGASQPFDDIETAPTNEIDTKEETANATTE